MTESRKDEHRIVRDGKRKAPSLWIVYECPECHVRTSLDAYDGPPTCRGQRGVDAVAHPPRFMTPLGIDRVQHPLSPPLADIEALRATTRGQFT